jgi:hypothetical protein
MRSAEVLKNQRLDRMHFDVARLASLYIETVIFISLFAHAHVIRYVAGFRCAASCTVTMTLKPFLTEARVAHPKIVLYVAIPV